MTTRSSILAWKIPGTEKSGATVHEVVKSWTRLSTTAHTKVKLLTINLPVIQKLFQEKG